MLPGKESELGPTFGSPMCPTLAWGGQLGTGHRNVTLLTTWVSIAYYNFDFQAGLGHPQQSQHLVPTARNLATLGDGGHRRLQGLIKYQQDPIDEFLYVKRQRPREEKGNGQDHRASQRTQV